MNITDELREYADRFINNHDAWIGLGDDLADIADRIDAEYQKAEDEWKAKGGQSWLHGYEECHLELMEGNEAIAASLEEAGWVKLQLDANGVPIHVGDRMEHIELGYVCEVIAVGVDCFIAWNTHLNRYWQYDNKLFRHHHAHTVEDELTDLCERVWESALLGGTWSDSPVESYITEYAAKLQLRGDVE